MAGRWCRGVRMCDCMIDTLPMIEERLRCAGVIKSDLSGLIYQGSYSGGVAASASTHSGGGAIDVRWGVVASDRAVRAWRESGVALWRRPQMSPPHGHGVWVGCGHVSRAAARQVRDYRQGRNGLAGRGVDTDPRPGVVSWQDALHRFKQTADPIISAYGLIPAP